MATRNDYIRLSEVTTLSGKIGLILGGLPEDSDNLPSVLFITLYSALFVPIVWRIQKHTLTFGQVWKPLLVVMMRIATFALRIKLSDGQEWSQDIFVTQLILLRLGPIILTSSLLCLLRDAVLPYLPSIDQPNFLMKLILHHFVSLLNLATYFAFGLTIAIAFDVKAAINGNEDARIKMHKSKQVSIWLLVAIDTCVYLIAIIPIVRLYQNKFIQRLIVSHKREESKFMAILSVCTFLLVVSAFKALQLAAHGRFNSGYALVVNKKILFYCVCCAGEYVACLLLVALPWARMVPPPELIEALCRIGNQNENNNDHPPSGNDPNPNLITWPQPPPPLQQQTNTTLTTVQSNGEYHGNHGGEEGDLGRNTMGSVEGGQMRAPGGVYGDQGKQIIPKYPTLQRISIPQEYSSTIREVQNAPPASQSFPRPFLLSPSSSPSSPMGMKDQFIKQQQSQQDLRNALIGNSQPLTVFHQDSSSSSPHEITGGTQTNKRNSRSFLNPSGAGGNTKRASIASLSTISEVGDEKVLTNTRSIYRNSVWHPRNSVLSIIESGGGGDGDGSGSGSKNVPQHNSWESTHSSTHSAMTAASSGGSSVSLTLPPHLIPIAPFTKNNHSPPLPSPSISLPPLPPIPQKESPTDPNPIIITKEQAPMVTINLHPIQSQQQLVDDPTLELNKLPLSAPNFNSPQFSIQNAGLQPKQRQLSTCSVRSYWSDDSENGGGNGASASAAGSKKSKFGKLHHHHSIGGEGKSSTSSTTTTKKIRRNSLGSKGLEWD